MAGQFCTSCNFETAISPLDPGPFDTVVGNPVINVGMGPAGNNTITLPQGSQVGIAPIGMTAFALGFGMKMAAPPTALTTIVAITLATAGGITLSIDPTGALSFRVGGQGTISAPSGTFLFNGSRQYLGLYISGIGSLVRAPQTVTIQYEGAVVGTGPGGTQQGTSYSNFVWGALSNLAAPMEIDSLYLLDLTGSARNYLLGKRVVLPAVIVGAGQFSQYAPVGAPAPWQCVAPIPPGGDLLYAWDTTIGDQLACAVGAPSGLASVDFVMQRASARQEISSGGRSIALGIGDGTNVVYGPTQTLPVDYTGLNQVWDKDPTTGADWTLPSVSARQAAVKTVS